MNAPLLFLDWLFRMLRDIVWLGRANRTYALSVGMLLLLLLGLVVLGAQVSAPFIYTLF